MKQSRGVRTPCRHTRTSPTPTSSALRIGPINAVPSAACSSAPRCRPHPPPPPVSVKESTWREGGFFFMERAGLLKLFRNTSTSDGIPFKTACGLATRGGTRQAVRQNRGNLPGITTRPFRTLDGAVALMSNCAAKASNRYCSVIGGGVACRGEAIPECATRFSGRRPASGACASSESKFDASKLIREKLVKNHRRRTGHDQCATPTSPQHTPLARSWVPGWPYLAQRSVGRRLQTLRIRKISAMAPHCTSKSARSRASLRMPADLANVRPSLDAGTGGTLASSRAPRSG